MPSLGKENKYKSKPVTIEAYFLTRENIEDVAFWCGGTVSDNRNSLFIPTLEGVMRADVGIDWILKGTAGEFYPCKNSVFQTKYELI
jgi:hypothetical protein